MRSTGVERPTPAYYPLHGSETLVASRSCQGVSTPGVTCGSWRGHRHPRGNKQLTADLRLTGGPGRDRTCDQGIMSPPLSPLSYEPKSWFYLIKHAYALTLDPIGTQPMKPGSLAQAFGRRRADCPRPDLCHPGHGQRRRAHPLRRPRPESRNRLPVQLNHHPAVRQYRAHPAGRGRPVAHRLAAPRPAPGKVTRPIPAALAAFGIANGAAGRKGEG